MIDLIKRFILFVVPFRVYVAFYLRFRRWEKVYLYGAGAMGVEIIEFLQAQECDDFIWIDIRANHQPYQYWQRQVFPTTELKNVAKNDVVVICSEAMITEMLNECLRQGVRKEQVVVAI